MLFTILAAPLAMQQGNNESRGEAVARTGGTPSSQQATVQKSFGSSRDTTLSPPDAQPLTAHTETHTTDGSATIAQLLHISGATLDLVEELIKRSERSTSGFADRGSGSSGGGSSINTSNFVTRSLLTAQTNATHDSFSDSISSSIDSLSDDLEESIDTGTLTVSGNVGIGTTSPGARLDIDTGDFRVFGDIRTDAGSERNTFLGVNAGAVNDADGGGTNNTFIGNLAGESNTTGDDNTAIGYRTFIDNTTGFDNVAIGINALLRNTEGTYNIGIGTNNARDNATGTSNLSIGYSAMRENEGGSRNVALGEAALEGPVNNSSPNNTVAVGYRAGVGIQDGKNNIILGYQAGDNLQTGSNNIILGYDIDAQNADDSNTLTIGNLIFGTGIDGTGTTISSGNIGIASSTPSRTLTVAGTAAFTGLTNDGTGYYACVNTSSGELSTSTTACGASSERYKENVKKLTYGIDTINDLRPVSFDWKEDYLQNGSPQIGFIAEEVASTVPEVIGYSDDGKITNVDYPKLTAVLTAGLQELYGMITSLAEKVSGFAERFVTRELCIADENGATTCLTKTEIDDLLEQANVEASPDTSDEEMDDQGDELNAGTGTSTEQTATTTTEQDDADSASSTEEATDTTPPEITLAGEAEVEITEGDSYTDPGYTAADDTDGDITGEVVVGGDAVDTSAADTYTITYNVTDAAGNAAEERVRTVTVMMPEEPSTEPADDSTETATSTTSD